MGDPKGFLKIERELPKKRAPLERISDFYEHAMEFSSEKIKIQASRCMDCGIPFCMSGCTLGNLIPDFHENLYKDRLSEAVRILLATNNFPEFTGRVCPAPCESSCVLGVIKSPVTIKNSELGIIEQAFEAGLTKPQIPKKRTGNRVIIVGAGPAGLACAQQLNKAGHSVLVVDKNPTAGGLLAWGIPEYKLPSWVLSRRIDLLKSEGIDFRLNCRVGQDVSFKGLKEESNALVLCIGSETPNDLCIPGRENKGIHFAIDFLSQQRAALRHTKWSVSEPISAKNKDVIVIGGGDTGSDCIGTAIRQKARSVTSFEIKNQLPLGRSVQNPWPQYAQIYRISSAKEENIALTGCAENAIQACRFLADAQQTVCGIETVKVSQKQFVPEKFVESSTSRRKWDCQLVLLAMGYAHPILAPDIVELGVKLDKRQNIATLGNNKMTTAEGVFAAGDCRQGQSLVVTAIAEGRDTASCVDTWLTKTQSQLPRVKTSPSLY